jgi:hypothetical protein
MGENFQILIPIGSYFLSIYDLGITTVSNYRSASILSNFSRLLEEVPLDNFK